MARILAALSGGVDSAVAAALLVRDGHEVVGAYMKNWINEEKIVGDCPWEQDIVDARAVADKLGIEFRVVNLMKEYRERVVSYLLDGYRAGVTPNPDVMCNREMKFGVFLDYALDEGFESVATGHYARTKPRGDGTVDMLRGADPNKDQSYFLALMDQRQVSRALFPVGDILKPKVRELAQEFGLPNAAKKDSQGICFIGEVKMSDFLRAFVDDKPGDIVGLDGTKLGEHKGLHLYTLGQRRGVGVASNTFGEAYVVVAKRGETNELVVAFDKPETPLLYADRCRVGTISFANDVPGKDAEWRAQPRYRSEASRITFDADGEGGAEIVFERPRRAMTPGQICAFYECERMVGGGFFTEIHHERLE